MNTRYALKEVHTLFNRHFKHVINALALVKHVQGFAVVPFAAAHLARHVNIGQKVHFYFKNTVALAGFAPAALNVKGEPPRGVAVGLRVLCRCEKLADIPENARVCGGV